MLIKSLTLSNFGLFKNEHVIDLRPRKTKNASQPIILFGGLNGAGKTTILTAIRLAIYGKQSLGRNVSQKAYDEFLISKIHKNPDALVATNGSKVSLDIVYYKLGKSTNYNISRSWSVSGKQVNERLIIRQDGQEIPDFSKEQFQAFLNELIPLGVSELFFFDGEKIAKLADDGGDETLGDAIRKLLGIDIIERLKSDLSLYIRKQNNKFITGTSKSDLEGLEKTYINLKQQINNEELAAQVLHPLILEEKTKLSKLEEKLSSEGGAWVVSREFLKSQVEKLLADKRRVEAEIREHLASYYPFSLAPRLMSQLRNQLQNEKKLRDWEKIANVVSARVNNIQSAVLAYIPESYKAQAINSIHEVFSDLVERPIGLNHIEYVHGLGNKDIEEIEKINSQTNEVTQAVQLLCTQLLDIEEGLANISLQLDRAPDEETLQATFEEIKLKIQLISDLNSKRNAHFENARKLTRNAIEVLRSIKKIEEKIANTSSKTFTVELALQTQNVLSDFVNEMTKRKITKLENEFSLTFSRLARKAENVITAKINPDNFEVHLFSAEGVSISKQNLSAGEKQIYAVAMLEALAKTSGRKLPIIIDTPLGRLDSIHREKIVNNYFPHASHQVIILSTDTEIDHSHFENISQYVSHSYRINYDYGTGSSYLESGYFWEKIKHSERKTHASQ